MELFRQRRSSTSRFKTGLHGFATVCAGDDTLLDEFDCELGEIFESGLKAAKKSSQLFSNSST